MNKILVIDLISLLAAFVLSGCISDGSWGSEDATPVEDLIVEFDLSDTEIGSRSLLSLNDSLLIIVDLNSSDKLGKVYRINNNKERFEGAFISYGPGPYEVGTIGSLNLYREANDNRIKAQVFNYSQNCVLLFDVDSALADGKYQPARICDFNGHVLPSDYVHINDTLGFARKITIDPSGNSFTQALGKFNIRDNILSDFAPNENIDGNMSVFDISEKYGLVVEASSTLDMIKIYDFEGKLLNKIIGSQYSDEINHKKAYFSCVIFADDLILGVYSGGSWNNEFIGTKLVVIDKDGNYITTLDLGKQIRDLKYHEPSGMLYLTFINDDMQIGKLNLNHALIAAKSKRRVTKTAKKAKKQVAEFVDGEAPLHFVKNTPAGKTLDTSNWVKSIDFGEVELMPQEDSTFMIFKSLTIFVPERLREPDTLHIEKIVMEPEGQFKFSFGVNTVQPATYAAEIGFRQDNELKPFKGKLKIYVKEYSKPSELEISGHFTRMESF